MLKVNPHVCLFPWRCYSDVPLQHKLRLTLCITGSITNYLPNFTVVAMTMFPVVPYVTNAHIVQEINLLLGFFCV